MSHPKKNPRTQNLKLEFDDTFKTNNSSSQVVMQKKKVFSDRFFFFKYGININTQVETTLLWNLFSIYDTVSNYFTSLLLI